MNSTIIKALLVNTLQKEIRNKTLLFLFILSIFLILLINQFSVFFVTHASTSGFNWSNTKMSVLCFVISLWGGLLSFILGVGTIKSDMDHGVCQQIVAFPISSKLYLAARIFGTWIMVSSYYIATLILALLIFSISESSASLNPGVFLSFAVFSLKILVCITLAALLSIHFSKIMAFVSSIVVLIMVNISNSNFSEGFTWSELGPFSMLGLLLHSIFPRIGVVDELSKNLLVDRSLANFNLFEGAHLIISYLFLFWITFLSLKGRDYQGAE